MQPFKYFDPSNRGQINYTEQYNKGIQDREDREQKKKLLAMEMGIAEDKFRQNRMLNTAKQTELLIRNGDMQGAMNLLSNNAQQVSESGGNPRETMQVYQALRAGQPKAALEMIGNFRQLFDPSFKVEGASEKQFAPDVSPIQTDPESGQQYVVVTDRNTGQPERVDIQGGKALTPDQKMQREVRLSLLDDARKVSKDAFDQLSGIRSTIGNYDDAIAAIDEGASSGVVDRFLPSFRESTVKLENAAQRLGLNVISATTFGALSEGELRLAMSTAVPTNLKPKELRSWLVEKKKSQMKLAKELSRMAVKLGKGKTTIAEYLEKVGYAENEKQQDPERDEQSILSQYGL